LTIISNNAKIFFSGIGGSGMSSIACYLAEKGHVIFGSDRTFDRSPQHPLAKYFRSRGITVVPQDGRGLDGSFSSVVFSSAIESDCPEFKKAIETGVPIRRRAEFLAEISASFDTIAVTGTSGKTTTSGMLAFIMSELGLHPGYIGGGRVKQFRTSLNPGNYMSGKSQTLIIEACESEGSIVNYRPEHSMILNLSLDHNPVAQTAEWLTAFLSNTAQKVVLNADDDNLLKIGQPEMVTFSVKRDSDYRAEKIDLKPFSTVFSVRNREFILNIPGRHNLYNALSCISLLSEIGLPLDRIAGVLPRFRGIDRRFDIYLNNGSTIVIDDYAHNPHKISFLIDTVKRLSNRGCFIFQPHGYGPTSLMKEEYIMAFSHNLRNTDHLVLLPIFYSGGKAKRNISSSDLADGIRAAGASVEVVESRSEITDRLRDYDAYVVFGARDETLSELAMDIAAKLKEGRLYK
jgi:UDP-N-acetylmuramate--alanine ligase